MLCEAEDRGVPFGRQAHHVVPVPGWGVLHLVEQHLLQQLPEMLQRDGREDGGCELETAPNTQQIVLGAQGRRGQEPGCRGAPEGEGATRGFKSGCKAVAGG